MDLVLQHIPHIIPAVIGLAFLVRFGICARRLPPSNLTDDQLADWQRTRSGSKGRARRGSVDPDDVQLTRPVGTANQGSLDVRAAAGSGNQGHN